jgi:hypothetical protein
VIDVPEDWVTGVLELCDDEAIALWTAIQSGFLLCSHPTHLLVRTHVLMRFLEGRTAVILLSRPSPMWKIVVSVPDLGWLPRIVQYLAESGAITHRIMPEVGVVSALVPGHRAHGIAKEAATFGTGCTWEPESVDA